MKKILFTIAALFCTTLSFAQEYMIIETAQGPFGFPVNEITQVYFYTVPEVKINTCAEVINGEDGQTYRVRGEITEITNSTWGNFYMKDETGEIYIYGTLDATGATKNFASMGIEVGDIVTVEGPKKTYNGTAELVDVTVIKIEKPVIGPKGAGTLADPYNVQAVLNYIETLEANVPSEQDFYIKGYITSIREQYGSQYGNATFTISDKKTGTNAFTFYRGYYFGNVKYTEGTLPKEGDEVIICGKVVKYRGTTPETAQGEAYLYSLNGKTESDTPAPDDVKVVTIAQFNAAEVSNEVWYQLTGVVNNLKDGDQYGNFDLVDATDSVYVYGLLSEKGGEKKLFQELVAAKGIKNGSKITIIGTRGEFKEKIEVMNAYFVSIEDEQTR